MRPNSNFNDSACKAFEVGDIVRYTKPLPIIICELL
jgi:hypothetical protein